MQNVDHKELRVKCANEGYLRAIDYSHIYLSDLDFRGESYVCLKFYLYW